MKNPIVDLKNININHDEKNILSDISLSVRKGEFIYLIGKTGSGKSSLLKILYGDIKILDGEGSVAGINIVKIKEKEIPFLRRKLGIVFQDFKLLSDRSIKKNLEFVLKATDWKDKQKIEDRIQTVLEKVKLQLENVSLNKSDYSDEQVEEFIKPLELISFKPILYVCNVGENDVISGNDYVDQVKKEIENKDCEIIIISAKIESEINELDSIDEKKLFLDDLGLVESGSNKLIRASYKLLNLHSYFTAGEKEVRGWTIKVGDSAYDAAGQIHTDFQKGFICAEVISYDDYVEFGSESKVKEAGKMRLEGKEYIVSDGDIMHFRFNI